MNIEQIFNQLLGNLSEGVLNLGGRILFVVLTLSIVNSVVFVTFSIVTNSSSLDIILRWMNVCMDWGFTPNNGSMFFNFSSRFKIDKLFKLAILAKKTL